MKKILSDVEDVSVITEWSRTEFTALIDHDIFAIILDLSIS